MDETILRYLALHGLDGIVRIPQEEYDGFPSGE
jgi:hypothetical protein